VNRAPVNGTTALAAAAQVGHKDEVFMFLNRGADVNLVAHAPDSTALIAAAQGGHKDVVSLLLDRGADVNMVTGQYGTALIAAICMSDNMQQQPVILSMLLDRNPDVSIKSEVYGTALTAAISKLHFEAAEHTSDNCSTGWHWTFLNRLLSSIYLAPDHINAPVGAHGTPLAAAISKGNLQLLHLLVEKGGDVSRVGDSCGIALRAALAAEWDSHRLYGILQYLVDNGADINVVSSRQFGSPLGEAAYLGDSELVSFLLGCGADLFHVGGTHYYRAALGGAYPNALDAARSLSGKAQPELIAMLSDKMKSYREPQRSPPFPMPYTRPTFEAITVAKMDGRLDTCSDSEWIGDLPAYAALTAQHADIPCAILKEELVVKALVQLVIGIL